MAVTNDEQLAEIAGEPISQLRGDQLEVLAPERRPRVVVVGAGFGGLNVVRALGNRNVDVLLLDRNNYHGFWPLLYQVATSGLETSAVASPVRTIVRKYPNVGFEIANVTGVDFDKKVVQAEGGASYPYDYLALAAGSAPNYFGNNSLATTTYDLKDLDDAEELRNAILSAFEKASAEPEAAKRKSLLTFVIIGGGPTGVELAGSMVELIQHVMKKDYPMLDMDEAYVVIVEALDRIMGPFPENLQKTTMRKLLNMGVKIKLNSPVDKVQDNYVYFKNGDRLASHTIIWTAGVRGSMLAEPLGLPLGRGFRVKVQETLNVADHPEVFVVGDMGYLEGFKENMAYPQIAPVAMQQGTQAGQNILALIDDQPLSPFQYWDKGNLAIISRGEAVMDLYKFQLVGIVAWLGWLAVHLFYLHGLRNRLVVLLNWIDNFFTFHRGVRLINWNKQIK